MRRSFLAVLAALATAIAIVGMTPGLAAAATTSTLVNFNSAGQQTVRFDTNGNAIDAHDGQLARFGNTYYLYGTSYNCGYRWQINSSFCGFKVYSSPDLVHWTDQGFVVPPYTCGDCFRPHVIYDPATSKYVLWTNDSSTAPGDFRVYTSDSPTGPFTQQPLPKLAYSDCGWDFGLFQDPVTGRGYMVDTDCPDGDKGLIVQQLAPDDLTSDGQYDVIHMTDNVESPAMFYRQGTYYITMSDPTCGYCTATGTGYLTASNPLGTWTGSSTTDPWTIQNGALHVTGGEIGLSAAGSNWSDYTFAADVTPLQTASQNGVSYAQAGMVARMSDSENGYAFLLSNYPYTSPAQSGYIAFVKFTNGNPVSVQPVALPFAVTGGTSYHVAITVSGSTISAAVNGTTVDTVTDSSYTEGKVGFREFSSNNEQAIFDNVSVTAPDGTVLMSDDFSNGLGQWDPPPSSINSNLISTNSCGGQPSFVAPPIPQRGGSPLYLYGSDLWDGSPNEALANYFWSPLKFGSGGAIEPIDCSPSVSVNLAVGKPGQQAPVPGLDQSSGIDGFTTSCNIAGDTEAMQTFTAGRTGTLSQARLTVFQEATPAWTGQPPNEPLTLRLVTLNAQGGIGQVLATQSFATSDVGWAPDNVEMTPDVPVTSGSTYAIVASSATTQGCYGVATSTANPYPGGYAAASSDGGQTFTAQPGSDLKFLTVVN
jgi:Glycosyl hydrolases family 43